VTRYSDINSISHVYLMSCLLSCVHVCPLQEHFYIIPKYLNVSQGISSNSHSIKTKLAKMALRLTQDSGTKRT